MTAGFPPGRSEAASDPQSDAWLVGKARGGDVEAYEVLVRRHRTRVYRTALRITGNGSDAEDVVQDVFIQAWSALAGFAGAAAFTTWLYRITVNRALSHRAAGRRLVRHDPAGDRDETPVSAVRST